MHLRCIYKKREISLNSLNHIQDGLFWGCSHISYNDETWNNCTLSKEDPKNIWITWHNLWVLLTSVFFRRKSANFAISGNKPFDTWRRSHTFWYIISISTFLESLKIVIINMVKVLMMSAKMPHFWGVVLVQVQ